MSSLRDKLKSELHEAPWADLRPHMEKDVLITVSQDLDLLEIGEKVASDDKTAVGELIDRRLIAKPTPSELSLWEKQLQQRFLFLIVYPFVLIQKKAN